MNTGVYRKKKSGKLYQFVLLARQHTTEALNVGPVCEALAAACEAFSGELEHVCKSESFGPEDVCAACEYASAREDAAEKE